MLRKLFKKLNGPALPITGNSAFKRSGKNSPACFAAENISRIQEILMAHNYSPVNARNMAISTDNERHVLFRYDVHSADVDHLEKIYKAHSMGSDFLPMTLQWLYGHHKAPPISKSFEFHEPQNVDVGLHCNLLELIFNSRYGHLTPKQLQHEFNFEVMLKEALSVTQGEFQDLLLNMVGDIEQDLERKIISCSAHGAPITSFFFQLFKAGNISKEDWNQLNPSYRLCKTVQDAAPRLFELTYGQDCQMSRRLAFVESAGKKYGQRLIKAAQLGKPLVLLLHPALISRGIYEF